MTATNAATYAPTPTATHITVRPTLNLRTSKRRMSSKGTEKSPAPTS